MKGHVPEGGSVKFEKYPERGTVSVAREGDPTKSGYLTFDLGGLSTTKWRTLYQGSESNKAPRGEPNQSIKAILKIPQDTFPDNFHVKVPSEWQSVFQVSSKIKSK